jgi:hypothetical protein
MIVDTATLENTEASRVRAYVVAGILAVSTSFLAAQTPVKVDGLDASSAQTVISASLVSSGTGSYSKMEGLQEWVSDFAEFNSHLVEKYRARYDFRLEGTVLWVTMSDLQEWGPDGWGQTVIPAKGAEQKLILQMVDRLNAARSTLPAAEQSVARPTPAPTSAAQAGGSSQPPPATANPQPAQQTVVDRLGFTEPPNLSKAKMMVFDGDYRYRCSDGLCAVEKSGLWGFVDYHGNLVLDFKYSTLFHSPDPPLFKHGACLLQFRDSSNQFSYGYIDKKGNLMFGGKLFYAAEPFDDVVARVNVGGNENYFLDLKGNLAPSDSHTVNAFHDGLARDGDFHGYGFRNSKNQWAIPPIYSGVQDFHEGIAWVAKKPGDANAMWGAIDKTGKQVVPFNFSQAPQPFSKGMARVSCKNPAGFGYINTSGELIIACRTDRVFDFVHGHAWIWNDKWILVDEQGKAVAGYTRSSNWQEKRPIGAELREDGTFQFNSDYGTGVLDDEWNVLLPAAKYSPGLFPPEDDPDGLAYVILDENPNVYRGFVNRHGEFILLQQDSQF